MILAAYVLVSALSLAVIVASRSKKFMNIASLMHETAYFLIPLYSLAFSTLPLYFTKNSYFFMDYLALYEALISSAIFFVITLYLDGYIASLVKSRELNPKNIKLFYICTNLLLISITFAFFSNSLALFWIFLELTTILSAVLIVILNAKDNIYAALKYVFIASTSMLFSFMGLILLYTFTKYRFGEGTLNWSQLMINAGFISPKVAVSSFIFIFIGFAAKAGIVPFHTWLPHAHSKAPSAISAVLSGVLLNVGTYGIIRVFAIAIQTSAKSWVSLFLIMFGIFTLLIASFSMLQQTNTKKLIAFSSIEHMGIVLIGVGIATKVSIFWSLFYILAHSLAKSLLFLCAGILNRQYDGNDLSSVKDLIKLQPFTSFGIFIGSLAIIGMPPFILFLPKFFILMELSKSHFLLFFIVLLLILIASGAFARYITKIFSSVSEDGSAKIDQFFVSNKMKLAVILLVMGVVILGIFIPQKLQFVINSIIIDLGIPGA